MVFKYCSILNKVIITIPPSLDTLVTNNNNSNNKEAILEKRVSFNKDIENEITDTYRQKTPINRVNTTIQNNLFNKLKRKTNEIPLDIVDTPNTPTTAPDRITDIEENIKLLKDNQEKIL